jgi:hypothetical protein
MSRVGLPLLAVLSIASAAYGQTGSKTWSPTFAFVPTDQEVDALMWASEGCLGPARALAGVGPNDDGSNCPAHRISRDEGRRIVELGVASGGVRWCSDYPDQVNPSEYWLVSLGQVSMDARGQPWSPAIGPYPSLLHGMAQGYTRNRLTKTLKACTKEYKSAAIADMVNRISIDVQAGAIARPKPGDVMVGPDGKQTVVR